MQQYYFFFLYFLCFLSNVEQKRDKKDRVLGYLYVSWLNFVYILCEHFSFCDVSMSVQKMCQFAKLLTM